MSSFYHVSFIINFRYNDVPLFYKEEIYQKLRSGGVDHLLAQHASQFITRDPLVLFEGHTHQNGEDDMYHFERFQYWNYRSIRLKYPLGPEDGWRLEFRPCDLQLTDFDNVAVACFIVLLTRIILKYNLNFLIPISKVDENMQTAQKRNAFQTQRFWFRKNIFDKDGNSDAVNNECTLMTADEIINGDGTTFCGLMSLINQYLSEEDVDIETNRTIQKYSRLVQQRASGEVMTTASWIRKEILNHPDYK